MPYEATNTQQTVQEQDMKAINIFAGQAAELLAKKSKKSRRMVRRKMHSLLERPRPSSAESGDKNFGIRKQGSKKRVQS